MSDLVQEIKNLQTRIKKAEAEVLLDSIFVGDGSNITVYPSRCPGKGRKYDIMTDNDGKPSCMFNGKRCPYLETAEFKLVDYTKAIFCKAI